MELELGSSNCSKSTHCRNLSSSNGNSMICGPPKQGPPQFHGCVAHGSKETCSPPHFFNPFHTQHFDRDTAKNGRAWRALFSPPRARFKARSFFFFNSRRDQKRLRQIQHRQCHANPFSTAFEMDLQSILLSSDQNKLHIQSKHMLHFSYALPGLGRPRFWGSTFYAPIHNRKRLCLRAHSSQQIRLSSSYPS